MILDSRKPIQPNYRNGGMKKEFEGIMTPQGNYSTTAGIHVGEASGGKGTFWPEVIQMGIDTRSDVIRGQADDSVKLRDGSAQWTVKAWMPCAKCIRYTWKKRGDARVRQ